MKVGMIALCFLFLSMTASNSFAGIYSDELSKCLVESSTANDKAALVRWMFSALSSHPQVAGMASVSETDREKSNKDAAAMFDRLLTETCVTQAKKAVQYEGPVAIQTAFNVFGQVAGRELFANPEVSKSITGLKSYIDERKIQETLGWPSE